jgi:fructose-specific component phosphotransferase system IIB-like protein
MAAPDLRRAVELLGAGDWQAAHAIVQEDGSALAAWLQGIVHLLEGDLDNSRYWYGKAGRAFRGPEAVLEKIAAARREAFDAGKR